MAHHRDEIAVVAGLDPQHAHAALGAVEGDGLDRAGQHLARLHNCLGLIGTFAELPS